MSKATNGRVPRAMIHRRILDEAAEHPSQSIAEIADRISGASVELVESVLNEYGDPADSAAIADEPSDPDAAGNGPHADDKATATAADDTAGDASTPQPESPETTAEQSAHDTAGSPVEGPDKSPTAAADNDPDTGDANADPTTDDEHTAGPVAESSTETTPTERPETPESEPDVPQDDEPDTPTAVSLADLTPEQRETIEAIRDRPEATQAELAEELGISRAAVSIRANSIPGLEWRARTEFVTALYDEHAETEPTPHDDASDSTDVDAETASSATTPADAQTVATAQLERLEENLNALTAQLEILTEAVHPSDHTDGDDATTSTDEVTVPTGGSESALICKLVRVCLEDERFSESETQQVMAWLCEAR